MRYSPAQPKAADVLDGMSWREFEMLVGETGPDMVSEELPRGCVAIYFGCAPCLQYETNPVGSWLEYGDGYVPNG